MGGVELYNITTGLLFNIEQKFDLFKHIDLTLMQPFKR
jgi:hypothetical protein